MKVSCAQKPDRIPTQHLSSTPLPKLDLSLMKVSNASGKLTVSSARVEHPNSSPHPPIDLFQYNDRRPLMFSSDEEEEDDGQPTFSGQGHRCQFGDRTLEPLRVDVVKVREVECDQKQHKHKPDNNSNNIPINSSSQNVPNQQKQPQRAEQKQVVRKPLVGLHANFPQRSYQDDQDIFASDPAHGHQPDLQNQTASSSRQHAKAATQNKKLKLKLESIKKQRESPPVSRTQLLIEEIKSRHNPVEPIKIVDYSQATSRDPLNQTSLTPRKKRRNKIFDATNSSFRKPSQTVTPEKLVQTGRKFNQTQYTTHSGVDACCHQIKALDVVERIIDKISPNSRVSPRHPSQGRREVEKPEENEGLTQFNNELQVTVAALNRAVSLDELLAPTLRRLRQNSLSSIHKWRKKLSQNGAVSRIVVEGWQEVDPEGDFRRLSVEMDQVDLIVSKYERTRQRLADLESRVCSLLILLQKRQFKKVFQILQSISSQVEQMKQTKATCGSTSLDRMLVHFLDSQISQLAEVERDTHEKFEDLLRQQRV